MTALRGAAVGAIVAVLLLAGLSGLMAWVQFVRNLAGTAGWGFPLAIAPIAAMIGAIIGAVQADGEEANDDND